jgi:methionyl-tRNA formyltransferase
VTDKLVMCGNHVGGVPVVRGLLDAGFRFDYFVCQPQEQAVREGVSGYHDFGPLAREHGIPVHYAERFDLKGPGDLALFRDQRFDALVQGGWQRLFPTEVLETLRIGAVGVHGSADGLPKGRGRSPLNWSLIEGRRRFVMQLFLITSGVDDGDVFDTETFDITPFDDIETLYFKYGIVLREMHVRSLPKLLAGEAELRPQVGAPTYYPKRTPADARIDWEVMDVWQIYDFVRGQTRPYPGAFADIDGRRHRIWRCRPFDTRIAYPEAAYGECVERFGDKLVLNCRGGLLLVDDYEVEAADRP